MNQSSNDYILGNAFFQNLFGLIRMLLFFFVPFTFASYCAITFHQVVPLEVAAGYAESIPFFGWLPVGLQTWIASVFNSYSIRYMIAPILAQLCVLFAGSYYVKDVYALPNFSGAFQYVTASMFASEYPEMVVDKGAKQAAKNDTGLMLIEKVGGPGFVRVEPGNAVVFHHLREPSQSVVGGSTYFLAPFETVYQVIDLDEQQCDKDEIKAITRDGIQVVLRDVHFRYSIRHRTEKDGRTVQRTPKDPYPFDKDALPKMAHNLSVDKNGLERWNTAVERTVIGIITDFIAAHSIDYLTAPKREIGNPHRELRAELFRSGVRRALESVGAELIWVDTGHLEIVKGTVDDQRTTVWAASWVGDSTVTRAYGDALRRAYSDLGRAQAQAEIILSITDALNGIELSPNRSSNIRRLLLARTAQVLDSLSVDQPKKLEDGHPEK